MLFWRGSGGGFAPSGNNLRYPCLAPDGAWRAEHPQASPLPCLAPSAEKCFHQKKFRPKVFQPFFRPKNFFSPKYVWPKICSAKICLAGTFFEQKLFGSEKKLDEFFFGRRRCGSRRRNGRRHCGSRGRKPSPRTSPCLIKFN